jgi:hypothetical protein
VTITSIPTFGTKILLYLFRDAIYPLKIILFKTPQAWFGLLVLLWKIVVGLVSRLIEVFPNLWQSRPSLSTPSVSYDIGSNDIPPLGSDYVL